MNRTKRLEVSGSTLKILAICAMLIDHTAVALLNASNRKIITTAYPVVGTFLYRLRPVLRGIGRIAFPIFCFLLVEGFLHTKNVKKYAMRLFVFALISEIPYDYALADSMFKWDHQNVYFTLLIGLLVMTGVQYFDYKRPNNQWERYFYFIMEVVIAGAGLYLARFLCCDYRYKGVFLIEVLYFLRLDRRIQTIFGALAIAWEATGPLAFIPIWLYNGKRGLKLKYVFYWFYPVHLLILGIIRHVVIPLIL